MSQSFALECVRRALEAAAALRGGAEVEIDPAHVEAAVRSERHVRLRGALLEGFAPLSRFWQSADGWVRTHANYSWHEAALLRGLGTSARDPATVAAMIAALPSQTVEDGVYGAGGLAVAVRSSAGWAALDGAARPLIATHIVEGAPARPDRDRLRVLDLTRVIAGPVATRMLGTLGHDVLRLDPPGRPELELHRLDGLLGKRSALLDAATPAGLDLLHGLLAGADVLVHGYRPGALSRFGLAPSALAERHPGLVVVGLSAWGDTPGWANRRGFDSLVQAATGLAVRHSPDGERPGALPCQLLDHATGYLLTAAVLEGVALQRERGGTPVAELSLAATAAEVLRRPPEDDANPDPTPWLVQLGDVTAVQPPGSLDGQPLRWREPPATYRADRPAWL